MAGSQDSQPRPYLQFSRSLLGRFLVFGGLLGLDILILAMVPHSAPLIGALAPFGIVSFAVFIGLGYSHFKRQRQALPFARGLYLAHLACVLGVTGTNLAALHGFGFLFLSHTAHLIMRFLVVLAIGLLSLACIPLAVWMRTIRETNRLWLYSVIAGGLAWCLRFPLQSMWDSSSTAPGRALQVLAFHSVKGLLRFFLPNILVDADTFRIGTPSFTIVVAEACSGLEGLGLVLVFTTIWLFYFRRESRFPQALLLVPCALVCVWMLNILRIAALVLIGNAGFGEIAMVGFHSQAGWIAFTTVAFTFSMVTRKMKWVRRMQYYPPPTDPAYSMALPSADGSSALNARVLEPIEETAEAPETGAYLIPFLAILAASFLSKSVSGYFEWLYPLRFVAALIALWYASPEIRKLNWRIGWLGPVAGLAVFLLWLIPSWLATSWLNSSGTSASALGASLGELSPAARFTWIAFRVAAASITVPIAEELAFRGYLARRIMSRDFTSVPFSSISALSIGLSSVAFGLMHGHQWIVGIVAGLAFAAVAKSTGRLSDAIVAHATSNLLLAIWVLSRGDFAQW